MGFQWVDLESGEKGNLKSQWQCHKLQFLFCPLEADCKKHWLISFDLIKVFCSRLQQN